jgi:hypothetical protein
MRGYLILMLSRDRMGRVGIYHDIDESIREKMECPDTSCL